MSQTKNQFPDQDPPHIFLSEYDRPDDQFSAELELRETYALQFPDSAPVLYAALTELQREAGINDPSTWTIVEEDRQRAEEAGVADLLNQPVGSQFFKALMLAMPHNISQEEYDSADQLTQREIEVTADGMTVVDMPAPTRELLSGLYALTGATVERDEREEGLSRGRVIRHGTYMDAEVFFEEDYDDNWSGSGKTAIHVRLLGHELAAKSIIDLNEMQLRKFIEISGVDKFEARSVVANLGATKHNYDRIAKVLRSTGSIIDNALGSESDQ